ncbi:SGNH/GDSL hydrolase family protein [Nocardioides sp. AE5]|uniref:SGNH/GDSL hydrolase family protein n=1 Tax=Nocardioides sp. AE5 TaxID=2962573 RepID=UPI002882C965|nr:SGNH/GDSL hydrolase family protein [Nocardioides sp. AE5]MDT0200892.1 SGNH/GDSL hydrolase family protein [Nocardioides sp. AE5]
MRIRDNVPDVVLLGLVGLAGATGFVAGSRHLLVRQAAAARAAIGKPLGEEAPRADKVYKKRFGDPVDLLLLGDSIAAGLGAESPGHTPGARLAKYVARATGRSVRLRTAAVVGSESSALADQVAGLRTSYRPDVAVIIVGGNDVTHRVATSESVAHLREAIRLLRRRGAGVVVGTCPDLGMLRPVPQPLRALGSRASRTLAHAQQAAALAEGAYAVSLSTVVGPFFITNPDEMFSLDRFHPSSTGYKRTAKAMLPSVLAALGAAETLPLGHHAPAAGDATADDDTTADDATEGEAPSVGDPDDPVRAPLAVDHQV